MINFIFHLLLNSFIVRSRAHMLMKMKKWTWVKENNYKQKGKCGMLLIECSDTPR